MDEICVWEISSESKKEQKNGVFSSVATEQNRRGKKKPREVLALWGTPPVKSLADLTSPLSKSRFSTHTVQPPVKHAAYPRREAMFRLSFFVTLIRSGFTLVCVQWNGFLRGPLYQRNNRRKNNSTK